jgi:hypothetical protein
MGRWSSRFRSGRTVRRPRDGGGVGRFEDGDGHRAIICAISPSPRTIMAVSVTIEEWKDRLLATERLDLSTLSRSDVPATVGLYGFFLRDGETVIYVGSATGVHGLRRRIWQQHLNPMYLEPRLPRDTTLFQLRNPIHRRDLVVVDKSRFRFNVGQAHSLRADQTVDYIKANFVLGFVELPNTDIEEVKRIEKTLIRLLRPSYNRGT